MQDSFSFCFFLCDPKNKPGRLPIFTVTDSFFLSMMCTPLLLLSSSDASENSIHKVSAYIPNQTGFTNLPSQFSNQINHRHIAPKYIIFLPIKSTNSVKTHLLIYDLEAGKFAWLHLLPSLRYNW